MNVARLCGTMSCFCVRWKQLWSLKEVIISCIGRETWDYDGKSQTAVLSHWLPSSRQWAFIMKDPLEFSALIFLCFCFDAEFWASLVAQMVKNLPAVQEIWVRSLGHEDSPGEGSGNPPQYSCLENPMDRGAWWATVHGVAKVGHDWSTNTFC